MKQELNDTELDSVTGGSVVMSESLGVVGFTSMRKQYRIKGNFTEMRDLLLKLYDENELSNAEFDLLVFNEFSSRGWI